MPVKGIEISRSSLAAGTPETVLGLFKALADGSATRAEEAVGSDGNKTFFLRKRNWGDWCEETVASLLSLLNDAGSLKKIADTNREAMKCLADLCLTVNGNSLVDATLLTHIEVATRNGRDFRFSHVATQLESWGQCLQLNSADGTPIHLPGNARAANKESQQASIPSTDDEDIANAWMNQHVVLDQGDKPARVDISNIDTSSYEERLEQLRGLFQASTAPLRLERANDEVLYLRERSWGEYFIEKIMGAVWPHQLADMKRDTGFMVENALSAVVSHIRLQEWEKNGSGQGLHAGIGLNDAQQLIGELQAHVWQARPSKFSSGAEGLSHHIAVTPLHGSSLNGVKRVPPGCSVAVDSPLNFAANTIIVPLAGKGYTAARGDRVLQQSLAVIGKARGKFREHQASNEQKGKETAEASQAPAAKIDGSDDAEKAAESVPVTHPLKMQSIRHANQLLLVQQPALLVQQPALLVQQPALQHGQGNDRSEQDWYRFYSSLLAPLEGTVAIGPYPDNWDEASDDKARKPYFSTGNLQGLVRACLDLTSAELASKKGKALLSIMIAYQSKELCEAIKQIMLEEEMRQIIGIAIPGSKKAKDNSPDSDDDTDTEYSDSEYSDSEPLDFGYSDPASSDAEYPEFENSYDGDSDLEQDNAI